MDQRRNLQAYANEKLSAAVEKLATHPEEVRIRLRVAVTESLWLVPASAVPTDLRRRFEAIMADLTKFKPSPEYAFTPEKGFGRTALSVTLQKIRKSTAAEIASRIVQLQSEVEWRLEHSEGKAITSPPTPSRGRHQRRRKDGVTSGVSCGNFLGARMVARLKYFLFGANFHAVRSP